jgi:hypothetical protein
VLFRSRQWHLLRPASPPPGFSPYDAATQRQGSKLNFSGTPATVMELFLAQTRSLDGNAASRSLAPEKMYGFVAAGGGDTWLARWTERGLTLHRGIALDEKTVLAAFTPGPEKPR